MLLWICFAVLTAAVVTFVIAPLQRRASDGVASSSADVAVYRDQLQELEAERDRGLVAADEVEAARAEVARRLLKRVAADEATPQLRGGHASVLSTRVSYAVVAFVPLVSISAYLATGYPEIPSRPFASRQTEPVQGATIADVIARIEERLRTQPDDGQGWEVIAPVYLRLGRYADAAHSFAESNRLLGESTKRLLGFAESTLLAEGGVVTEPVRQASLRVLELEPGRIEPRLWLTLGKEQEGDVKGAITDYEALLAASPADAPWRAAVSQRLALLARNGEGGAIAPRTQQDPGGAQAPGAAEPDIANRRDDEAKADKGPSADDVARVEAMSPEARREFITQMVNGLAARLKTNSKDLAGWLKLARAYKVLGREQDAETAIGEAKRNFADDPSSMAEIEAAAKALGP